jgi:capsular exopolysaccharide synthesis family protein
MLVLACVLIVPGVALALTSTQEKEYSASANLLFRDPVLAQTLFGADFFAPDFDATRTGETNIDLVSLAAISRRTAERLGGGLSAKDVEKKIEVEPGTDSDVATITATDPEPEQAAEIANTYAQEYIDFRRDADRLKVEEARELVEQQLAALPPEEVEDRRGDALRENAGELRVLEALQTGNAELVQEARTPTQASSPRPKRNVAVGLLLGLVLGAGLAIFLDRVDRRMRSADDVAELLGLPLLAAIPRSRALRRGERDMPLEREGVAFQMLRTNLHYFNVDRQIRSVMVTSAAAGDGKSTIAWHLATVDAMAGQRVLLLEADLRNPALHEVIGLAPEEGLAEVLAGDLTAEQAVQRVPAFPETEGADDSGPVVDVILAGWRPPNPAQLLESERMRGVLAGAEERYDVVVVDTPPMSVVSDAIPLVTRVSGVVVVARLGKSTRNGLTALKDQLVNLGAPTLGVVVNDVVARGESYDGYGYGIDTKRTRPWQSGKSRRNSARTGAGRKS